MQCKNNQNMGYPRLCAHRGFITVAPENTMLSLGAAVCLGANEIEFDLRCTKDGVIVLLHDATIDRTSDGAGCVWDMTYKELLQYDFGIKCREEYKGLRIPTFEQVLQQFGRRVVMNIELKAMRPDPSHHFPEEIMREIIRLIDKYDCRDYVYFISLDHTALPVLQKVAPDIVRGVGGMPAAPFTDLVEEALAYGCGKIQFGKRYVPTIEDLKNTCEKAHANGLICNMVLANTPELAAEYYNAGVDNVFTNNFQYVAQGVRKYIDK